MSRCGPAAAATPTPTRRMAVCWRSRPPPFWPPSAVRPARPRPWPDRFQRRIRGYPRGPMAPTARPLDGRGIETKLLLKRYARERSPQDRERLAARYEPLARSLAMRFIHTSEPFDDLLQVARLALLKAIDRFDPERGTAFTSLAVPTITGELRRHLRDHSWPIHVPRELQELTQRLG